jgi:hypothetical protein
MFFENKEDNNIEIPSQEKNPKKCKIYDLLNPY